jgi:hypothetical protein
MTDVLTIIGIKKSLKNDFSLNESTPAKQPIAQLVAKQ